MPTEQLPDASVDDGTEQRADRALLMDILGVLAPKQRSVVVLRHWEQMSTEETAAALGMSTGTVKSTLHRALARLRQELQMRDIDARMLERGEQEPGAVRGLTRGARHAGTRRLTAHSSTRDNHLRNSSGFGGCASSTVSRSGLTRNRLTRSGLTKGGAATAGVAAVGLLLAGCNPGGEGVRSEGTAGTTPAPKGAVHTPSPPRPPATRRSTPSSCSRTPRRSARM